MAENNKNTRNYKWIAIGVIILVIIIWAFTFLLFTTCWDKDERGTFGDMFGAVNALFSGLAFAGLIVTLIMQHEELGLQREELAQTNDELAAQREEFTAQTKIMKTQRFENTLFNMLSLQQGIVDSLDYNPRDGAERIPESRGKYVFDVFYNKKITEFGLWAGDNIHGIKGLIQKEDDIQAYRKVSEISIFDSYFRHLYRIFKYIDESQLIDDSERYNYSCIVRAQLSDYELLLLFYNALTIEDNGIFKFKHLIEKYAIFNNIRDDMLARKEDYNLYQEGAYAYKKESINSLV